MLDRLDTFLGEEDDAGRMVSYDLVAVAHHISAELFQALKDVGFTIPAEA